MAAGKGPTRVRVEVQRMPGGGYKGIIRIAATGALTEMCEHDDHPAPGKAVQCAARVCNRKGWLIVE